MVSGAAPYVRDLEFPKQLTPGHGQSIAYCHIWRFDPSGRFYNPPFSCFRHLQKWLLMSVGSDALFLLTDGQSALQLSAESYPSHCRYLGVNRTIAEVVTVKKCRNKYDLW